MSSTEHAASPKRNELDLETAIIDIEATITALDVIIDYATDKNADRGVAVDCLITMGRHLQDDMRALRKAHDPMWSEGGAA